MATDSWQRACTIALYASIQGEVETKALLNKALREGKRVSLPRVLGKGKMVFCPISAETLLTRGPFGIPEPPSTDTIPGNSLPDLILVPGLAFDRLGYRLGYGGGYYDRFLASVGLCERIGLTFADNLVAKLPHDPWDERMTSLCTEDGIIPI